jgi:ABC-2 type transport system permease protein
MANFVDYVKSGKPVIIFDDPLPALINPGLAPKQPKQKAGGPFGGGPPPEQKADGGRATSLVNLLGIKWNYDEIVWDNTIMSLHPEFSDVIREEMVAISKQSGNPKAFNENSKITSGLQEVLVFFAGSVQEVEGTKLEFTPLLVSGSSSGVLGWEDLVQSSFFGMEINPDPIRKEDDYAHVIAAEIEGTKENGAKVHAIYVADLDLLSDQFFAIRERKMHGLNLDNVTFVLNAIDHLAGDDSYIELRKRRPKHRTLTAVEAQTKKFIEERSQETEKAALEAKEALEKRKEEFAAEVKKIESDESLSTIEKFQQLSIARENQQRKLAVEEQNIEQEKEKQIEQSRVETEREIRAIENRFYVPAAAIPPIPAILLGLFVWMKRAAAERKDIAATRRRN